MTAVTQHRRSPLGLFSDQRSPRLYDRIVEVLRVRQAGVVLANRVSAGTSLGEPADRRAGTTPHSRIIGAKGDQAGCPKI
jgi:hypothetical protein